MIPYLVRDWHDLSVGEHPLDLFRVKVAQSDAPGESLLVDSFQSLPGVDVIDVAEL